MGGFWYLEMIVFDRIIGKKIYKSIRNFILIIKLIFNCSYSNDDDSNLSVCVQTNFGGSPWFICTKLCKPFKYVSIHNNK